MVLGPLETVPAETVSEQAAPVACGEAALVETAYAKINLALHVHRRRADGYHEMETLFSYLNDGDHLRVFPFATLELELTGPFAGELEDGEGGPAGDNLVIRAAHALREACKIETGARIVLDKHLPVAAGLGGGSADAAAAARLLNRFWRLGLGDHQLAEIISHLGADIAACVKSRTVIGRGIGDVLAETPLGEALRGVPVMLVNPLVACPTGPVFAGWNGVSSGALSNDIMGDDMAGWHNDLLPSAMALVPAIGDILRILRGMDGVRLCNMSGSGATCFALFEDQAAADSAAAYFMEHHPEWWQILGVIR